MSTLKSSAENLTLNADGANNDVIIQSNGSTVVTVDGSAGSVGIGTTTPSAKFEVEDGGTSNGNVLLKVTQDDQSSHYGLSVGNDTYNTTDSNGLVLIQKNDGHSEIHNGGSINVGFPVAGGMTFGSDTAAANALDDYEEGTWTPTAVSGLGSLTATDCHYRKIGSLVHIAGRVSGFGSITSSTLTFGGLPFNPTHSTSSGTVSTTFVDLDQGYQLWMYLAHDEPKIYLRYQMNNAQYESLSGSDVSSSSNIHFNATYIVD